MHQVPLSAWQHSLGDRKNIRAVKACAGYLRRFSFGKPAFFCSDAVQFSEQKTKVSKMMRVTARAVYSNVGRTGEKSWVFRHALKTAIEDSEVTCWGRLFQVRTAAAEMPSHWRQIGTTISDDDASYCSPAWCNSRNEVPLDRNLKALGQWIPPPRHVLPVPPCWRISMNGGFMSVNHFLYLPVVPNLENNRCIQTVIKIATTI